MSSRELEIFSREVCAITQLMFTITLYMRRRMNMTIVKKVKINVFHRIRLGKHHYNVYCLKYNRSEWNDV